MSKIVHCIIKQRGKDGKVETRLQAFEIFGGTRRPINTPVKNEVKQPTTKGKPK